MMRFRWRSPKWRPVRLWWLELETFRGDGTWLGSVERETDGPNTYVAHCRPTQEHFRTNNLRRAKVWLRAAAIAELERMAKREKGRAA